MNRIGTVDGTIAVVDSIINTILVTIEWTSLVVDNGDARETTKGVGVLVGVGRGVAEVGLVRNQVAVRIRAAKDVHVLLCVALELAFVGKGGSSRVGGAARSRLQRRKK